MNANPQLRFTTKHRSTTSDRIQTVTGDTFTPLVLEGEGAIAVGFMSYGCAHCRVIEPVLQQVAEDLKSTEQKLRHAKPLGEVDPINDEMGKSEMGESPIRCEPIPGTASTLYSAPCHRESDVAGGVTTTLQFHD